MSGPDVNVDVSREGDNIRIEFANTQLPPALQRRLDVTGFATPIATVDALVEPDKAILMVESSGEFEYLIYQIGRVFTLEVKPLPPQDTASQDTAPQDTAPQDTAPQDIASQDTASQDTAPQDTASQDTASQDTAPQDTASQDTASQDTASQDTASQDTASQDTAPQYKGKKITLDFQDIEIRRVLHLIAEVAEQNLVLSSTVAGNITLLLKDVPWDQALDIVMKTKGLDKRQEGKVLWVAPIDELAARDKLELENAQQSFESEPLSTEFIEVKYAKAADIIALFPESNKGREGIVSSRGSVMVDERTNSIILTETTERINRLRKVLAKLDVPVRQVLIEARIVTAGSQFSDALGIRWGGFGYDGTNSGQKFAQAGGSTNTIQQVRNSEATGDLRNTVSVGAGAVFESPDHLVVDLGVQAPGATSFAIGLLDGNFLLDLEISALVSEGNAEVIARPKVITSDKQEAVISSGVQIPYQEASSSGATSTSFKSATLELRVKPQITPDDRIIMDLEVKQDTIGSIFNGVPSINTNNIKTQVLVDNADTIVLGGIFTAQETQQVTKTPFFGDLPVIGALFRRKTTTDDKLELLIFIKPELILDTHTGR